jgi:hypothetical protein
MSSCAATPAEGGGLAPSSTLKWQASTRCSQTTDVHGIDSAGHPQSPHILRTTAAKATNTVRSGRKPVQRRHKMKSSLPAV